MTRRYWSFYLRLAMGVGLLAFLTASVGISVVMSIFSRIDFIFVVFVVITNILFFFIGGFNIWLVLISQSPLRFRHFISDYISAIIVNQFTPGQLGDSSLVYFLNKRGVPVSSATTAFLLDKFISISILMFFAWYASTVLLLHIPLIYFMLLPVCGMFVLVGLYVAIPYFKLDGIYLRRVKRVLEQIHEQLLFLKQNNSLA